MQPSPPSLSPRLPPTSASPPFPSHDDTRTSPTTMSWSEPLDSVSAHPWPLSSSFHSSRSFASSPSLFGPSSIESNYRHLASLEQNFCSDFSCCGLSLADLHELIDHFEESHVVVIGRDGRPVYPCPQPGPPASASDDRSAYTSVVLSYPQPGPPSEAPDMDVMMDFDPLDTDTTLSSPSGSGSGSASPEPMCLPPSLLSVKPAVQFPLGRPQASVRGNGAALAGRERGTGDAGPMGKINTRIAGVTEGRERRGGERGVPGKKRDREKAYKCPRAGCSKSYLNPNGLKYHLEKGTCTVDPSSADHP